MIHIEDIIYAEIVDMLLMGGYPFYCTWESSDGRFTCDIHAYGGVKRIIGTIHMGECEYIDNDVLTEYKITDFRALSGEETDFDLEKVEKELNNR